jgi:hypothetical protein
VEKERKFVATVHPNEKVLNDFRNFNNFTAVLLKSLGFLFF